jgi:hypothetical protein
VGEQRVQHLYLLNKKDGKIIRQSVLPVLVVPMTDEDGGVYHQVRNFPMFKP